MKKLLFFAFIIGFFTSCSSLKVTSDYDKTVDFTQFKTLQYYGWAQESDKILNRFDKERIEKAAAAEFRKRGIEIVEKDGDLIGSLYIVAEEKREVTANTSGVGGYYGYGGYYGHGPGWGGGFTTTTYNESEYTVGTLVISVFDAKNEKLIWEGIGSGTVNENPEAREKTIPQNIAKIMAKYPVKPVKK